MTKETEKQGTIDDLIKIINKTRETFNYEIFIPSLQKKVMFREINTAQQKRLVKAIIDSPAYNTEFIFALQQIIKENCVDNSININELTIYDKMIISLIMRSVSIGDIITMTLKSAKEDKTFTRELKLKELVEKVVNEIKIESTTIADDLNMFTVDCSLPTIGEEYEMESQLHKNNKNVEINTDNELRETIGSVFINEIVKYIKNITIKNKENDELTIIDLKQLDFKNRIKVIESLPSKLINKIIDYIGLINKEFEKILLVKVDNNGENLEWRLKIDSSFFMRS